MQTYQNARQTGDDCIKCGNPKKMYWCDICECNNETLKCKEYRRLINIPIIIK